MDRKVVRQDMVLRVRGKLFQTVGAAKENERRPEADLIEGMVSWCKQEERRVLLGM